MNERSISMSLKTQSFASIGIQKIDISCNIFKIRVVASPSDMIEISWKDTVMRSLEVKAEKGVLRILDHAAIGIYGTLALINLKKEAQLLVKLPASYAGKAVFQAKSESIHISDISSLATVGISTCTGEIILENTSFRQLDIRGNVGRVSCYSLDVRESAAITTKSGAILCNLLGNESDYSLSISTRNRRNNANGIYGSGSKKVLLNSDHGEIRYSFQNNLAVNRFANRYNRNNPFGEW